jgi:hypothetical protein
MASPQLLWECIKQGNCFLRGYKANKGNHFPVFSAEVGNLYNQHSYKMSGVCPAGGTYRR